jgi:site-specific recombinase XerD
MENDLILYLNSKDTQMVTYELSKHDEKEVILIKFPYEKKLIERVKKLVGVKWSNTKKAWYVLDTQQYRQKFGLEEKVIGKDAILKIAEINQANFQRFVETLQLKSYSRSTLKTYSTEFASYLCTIKNKDAKEISPEKLRAYFLYCLNELKMKENHLHSRINAIKFFYEQVLHNEKIFFEIPRPKKPLQIPRMFSKEDIKSIIKNTDNLKHKTMLILCYSSGLRVSEVVSLQIKNIDSNRMIIYLFAAKGKKDRIVPLSKTTLNYLRAYFKEYKPKNYLFEGQYNDTCYSTRSLQKILHNAKHKAGVTKEGSIHALRHSYATHLLDKGVDITYIQKILGHNDLKTTLRYLHVSTRDLSNIESPIEDLEL